MVKVTGNLNLQNRFFGRFRSIHDQNDARIHFTSGNTSHLQYLSVCLSVCLSVAYITYFCSFKYRENSISVTLHAAVFAYCEAPVASAHFCRVV